MLRIKLPDFILLCFFITVYMMVHQLRNDPAFVPELDFVHAGCL